VVTRLQVLLPDEAVYGNTYTPALNLAISPDGRSLAYVAGERLMMRSLDRLDVLELAAADGIRNPFFSPDGAWVGFTAGSELRKVRVGDDGTSVLVTRGLSSASASGVWNDSDIIYADGGSGLFRVPADGGLPERIVSAAGDDYYHRPVLMAGTPNLLVNIGSVDSPDIGIVDLGTGERTTLVPNARLVTYTRTGHLVFQRDGVVMGAAFDTGTRGIGSAVPVLNGVAGDNGLRMPQAVISDSGVLVYVPEGAGSADTVLAWHDSDGAIDVLGTLPTGSHSVSLSPDGRLAVIGRRTVPRQVVLWDMERRAPTRLSLEGTNPRWHPDGRRIGLGGGEVLRLFNVEDSGEEALGEPATLADQPSWSADGATSWSADGATVVYSVQRPGRDIVAITAGAPEPVAIVATDGNDAAPALSPDGRWLAYVSNQTGTFQVYLARFPSGTGRQQVSTGGGKAPLWSRDGRSLYYVEQTSNADPATAVMTVVSVESTDPLVLGAPRSLFPMIDPEHDRHADPMLPWGAVYDVADDGRVLMVWEPDQRYTELVVVQDWLDELTRIVPRN
jgi:Tol biopolymer transport system component